MSSDRLARELFWPVQRLARQPFGERLLFDSAGLRVVVARNPIEGAPSKRRQSLAGRSRTVSKRHLSVPIKGSTCSASRPGLDLRALAQGASADAADRLRRDPRLPGLWLSGKQGTGRALLRRRQGQERNARG